MASAKTLPSLEEVKSFISEYSKSIDNKEVATDLNNYIRHLKPKIEAVKERKEAKEAKDWLEWAKRLKEIKIVKSSVPVAILPNGYKAELLDVKVNSVRGPDDKIYDENEKIRQRVARGNCFLNISNGPHNGTTCILYGLKKFTGGLGDDDDRDKGDNSTWKKYFTQPLESTKNIISTIKANGEAGHFSCQIIDGQFIMCGGSKNVHLIFRRREDIERYNEPRYRIAREVCQAIMFVIELMDSHERSLLLSFLSYTHFTAIFEILSPDHQHVENFSHLTGNELRFITWTEINLNSSKENELCTVPPHVAIEIAKAFSLPTVDYQVLTMSDLDEHMTKIRKGYNYEGEVLYFLDEKSNVIGLLKKKTIWYILCRATREKIKSACTAHHKSPESFSISKYINNIEKRFGEIQSWLGLDNEGLKQWKSLAAKFLRWMIDKLENRSTNVVEVADKFPFLWGEFLKETDSTDQIQFSWSEPSGSDD